MNFPRSSGTSSGADGAVRRNSPEEYFKSREVHRSDRGFILVDAFRFVTHPYPIVVPTITPLTPRASKQHVKAEAPRFLQPLRRDPHRFFFLSHFHSDHYTGIQGSWHSDMIYCSRQTAALTQSELGVSSACLFPMDMNVTYVFSLQTGTCLACVQETPLHPHVRAMLYNTSPSLGNGSSTDDFFAVRLIPANHCPGAAILLFVSPVFGTVVHTGDFRFNGSQRHWRERIEAPGRATYVSLPQIEHEARLSSSPIITGVPPLPLYEQFIEDDAALREVAEQQALDVLFLDNTFCAPPYKFPTQWEVTQTVVEVLRSLMCRAASRKAAAAAVASPQQQAGTRTCVRCAVLVGCYTIGKERVALAIRDAFPRAPSAAFSQGAAATADGSTVTTGADVPSSWRIYVSPQRYSMLKAMDFFPAAFQPLSACPSTTTASATPTQDAPQHEASFASVVDTPVQLPVLLHSEMAQRCWTVAQSRCSSGLKVVNNSSKVEEQQLSSQKENFLLPPAPEVRRCLTSDFSGSSSQMPDNVNSPSTDQKDSDSDYRLSVFLVSMSDVNYKSVATVVRDGESATISVGGGVRLKLADYDSVLLVEPTGWCKRSSSRDVSERVTLLKVPYSEHCGFHEMIRFVQFVNPAMVVPTVSEDNYKAQEALFVEKAPRLRSRVSNVQPITRFFTAVPLNSRDATARSAEEGVEAKLRSMEKPWERMTSSTATTAVRCVKDEEGAPPTLSSKASLAAVSSSQRTAPLSQHVGEGAAPASRKNEQRKRPHNNANSGNVDTSAEAAKAAATKHTLDRLFQRVKTDTSQRDGQSAAARAVKGEDAVGDDDDDCQVVRVVQTVVEISDDD